MNNEIEWKKIFNHELEILFTDNGGIFVKAGCATLSFCEAGEFTKYLDLALKNPEKFEKSYFEYLKKLKKPNAAPNVMQNVDENLGCGR